MATCKKCKCEAKYCGCADKAIPVSPPCGQGTAFCPDPEPCPETFSAECIVYTGDSLPQLGISKGDRLDDIIQRFGLWFLNQVCIDPSTATCASVTGLHTTLISTNQVNLSWTAVSNATSYTIVYSNDNGATWNQIVPDSVNTFFSVTNLLPDTTYLFKVVTNCGTPGSCESLEIEVTTQSV